MLPSWRWVHDSVRIIVSGKYGAVEECMHIIKQSNTHWLSKLRICREREGRGLWFVSSGEPCSMVLCLSQARAPPRCCSFIHARRHRILACRRRWCLSCQRNATLAQAVSSDCTQLASSLAPGLNIWGTQRFFFFLRCNNWLLCRHTGSPTSTSGTHTSGVLFEIYFFCCYAASQLDLHLQ